MYEELAVRFKEKDPLSTVSLLEIRVKGLNAVSDLSRVIFYYQIWASK